MRWRRRRVMVSDVKLVDRVVCGGADGDGGPSAG
jgi:hypothetical protein